MRAPLTGRTAIVTGADHPIGAAASRALSGAGANVVLAATDIGALYALTATIRSAGGNAVPVPTDLANPTSLRRLIEQTLGAFGRLDAAVNNTPVSALPQTITQEIPPMRQAGTGRIVNLAPTPETQPATIELTRTAARTLTTPNPRINALAPTLQATPEAIATAVLWLCSAEPTLPSGQTLRLGPRPHRRG